MICQYRIFSQKYETTWDPFWPLHMLRDVSLPQSESSMSSNESVHCYSIFSTCRDLSLFSRYSCGVSFDEDIAIFLQERLYLIIRWYNPFLVSTHRLIYVGVTLLKWWVSVVHPSLWYVRLRAACYSEVFAGTILWLRFGLCLAF